MDTIKALGRRRGMGEEETDLQNWLIHFVCISEELRVFVANLDDLMANSSPPPGPLIIYLWHSDYLC